MTKSDPTSSSMAAKKKAFLLEAKMAKATCANDAYRFVGSRSTHWTSQTAAKSDLIRLDRKKALGKTQLTSVGISARDACHIRVESLVWCLFVSGSRIANKVPREVRKVVLHPFPSPGDQALLVGPIPSRERIWRRTQQHPASGSRHRQPAGSHSCRLQPIPQRPGIRQGSRQLEPAAAGQPAAAGSRRPWRKALELAPKTPERESPPDEHFRPTTMLAKDAKAKVGKARQAEKGKTRYLVAFWAGRPATWVLSPASPPR